MSIIEKAFDKLSDRPKDASANAPTALPEQTKESEQVGIATNVDVSPRSTPAVSSPSTSARKKIDLDFKRLGAHGFLTNTDERAKIAEEYRMIKRPLLANAFGPNPVLKGNLIMVCSSLPGEGKSFTAINLAISIAMELDRTVLLVDADVAKPSLPKYLGFDAEHGLLDVLRDVMCTSRVGGLVNLARQIAEGVVN